MLEKSGLRLRVSFRFGCEEADRFQTMHSWICSMRAQELSCLPGLCVEIRPTYALTLESHAGRMRLLIRPQPTVEKRSYALAVMGDLPVKKG